MRVLAGHFVVEAVIGLSLLAGCGGAARRNTISGAVSGAIEEGVVITLGGAGSHTATTAAGGTFSFTGLSDGSYTITPAAPGYTFSPTSATVTVEGGNTVAQTFVATALPGTLDARFGYGGIAAITLGAYQQVWANALAIQTDGKIVIAGSATDGVTAAGILLTRHRADGTLDPSFGSGGKVATSFGNQTNAAAYAVALQVDGKIVAAGWSVVGMIVARYTADGSLDPTFGAGGMVTTRIGSTTQATSVAIQADGKIVAVGYVGFNTRAPVVLVARYNQDGTLDYTFGTDGIVTTAVAERSLAHAVAVQTDGKIVVGGASEDPIPSAERSIILRYDVDGILDSGFGTGGIARLPTFVTSDGSPRVADDDSIHALAIQPDGKIVSAGYAGQSPLFGHPLASWFALARCNPDGSPDTSFGDRVSPGTVSTPFGVDAWARGVAIQADGKIVAGGVSDEAAMASSVGAAFALTRCNPDGSPDTTFGALGGRVNTAIQYVAGGGIAIQADGKIMAAGYTPQEFVLVRYWP